MATSPEELLAAAAVLGTGHEEVDWRNAASRAYYAAYHRCQPLAPNVAGSPGARGGSHEVFCLELMDTRRPVAVRSIGIMLDQCRKYRNFADYRINDEFTKAACLTTLQSTQSIFEKVKSLD